METAHRVAQRGQAQALRLLEVGRHQGQLPAPQGRSARG